jgi:hypothetical protein
VPEEKITPFRRTICIFCGCFPDSDLDGLLIYFAYCYVEVSYLQERAVGNNIMIDFIYLFFIIIIIIILSLYESHDGKFKQIMK